MTKTRFFCTAMAIAMLTGCTATAAGTITPGAAAQPGTAAQPGASTPASSKANGGAANSTEVAAALTEEREAEGYSYLAAADGAAKYAVMLVGAEKPPEGMVGITATLDGDAATPAGGGKLRAKVKADVKAKLDARKTKLESRLAKHVAKLDKAKEKIKAALAKADWKTNEDGTKTRALSFKVEKSINGKTADRDCNVERTLGADGELVKAAWAFSLNGPNGGKHTMTRTKDLQEDGSYKVVYHADIVLANGATRTRDFTKSISADGQVSGTGTIVWKDKDGKVVKTVNVTFSGTEEAEKAIAADPDGSTATVTLPVDGAVTAEVKDAAGATTAVTVTEAADGTVEAAAE